MTQEEYKEEARRLWPRLLQTARRYLNEDDAEDTVQDVLLRLLADGRQAPHAHRFAGNDTRPQLLR